MNHDNEKALIESAYVLMSELYIHRVLRQAERQIATLRAGSEP